MFHYMFSAEICYAVGLKVPSGNHNNFEMYVRTYSTVEFE